MLFLKARYSKAFRPINGYNSTCTTTSKITKIMQKYQKMIKNHIKISVFNVFLDFFDKNVSF